jgi:hypothetical protein
MSMTVIAAVNVGSIKVVEVNQTSSTSRRKTKHMHDFISSGTLFFKVYCTTAKPRKTVVIVVTTLPPKKADHP